ncbi:MAG: HAD family hydrolase [Gammaproteobacteria bacterium]|nr:HAD family hydrolase [Gammaproteobacteria bacterium]
MALAIFDLDNTLLAGDSDYLWGVFLSETGAVDRLHYEKENERFYRQYLAGELDIYEFLRFSMKPLRDNPLGKLQAWRQEFVEQKILPIILDPAVELVEKHRQQGDTLLIITATNSFVTAPIADLFGIKHLIATEPEMRDGHFTGEVEGLPSFREGKVQRLNEWLSNHSLSLEGSSFYSDSHNDMPLLERVDHPVAVDPDPQLMDRAKTQGWPVISLKSPSRPGADRPSG